MSILEEIPWWKKKWWDLQFYIELWTWKLFGEWYQIYIDLFWLHYYGFYPRAIVKSYHFETTFLFNDKDRAERAFQKCERQNGRAIGWYYAIEDFRWEVNEDDYYEWEDLNIWWVYE